MANSGNDGVAAEPRRGMRSLGRQLARFVGLASLVTGVMMLFARWYTGETTRNLWGGVVAVAGIVGGILLLLSFDGPAGFRRSSLRILGTVGVLVLATAPLTCKWVCA